MSDPSMRATTVSKRILVVDDTPTVADLIREMLVSFGYLAKICLDAREAVAEYAPGKFDLVITDYTMPGMNGVELSEIIRSAAPDQCILLITGSTFSMSEKELGHLPVNLMLQKPFSVDEFERIVARLTSGPALPPPHQTVSRASAAL